MRSLLTVAIALILLVPSTLMARTKQRVLVSVGDLSTSRLEWKKNICSEVHAIANNLVANGVDVVCRQFDTSNFKDAPIEKLRPQFDYHLRIMKGREQVIHVDVANWNIKDESDFKNVGWSLQDGEKTKVTKEEAFQQSISNLFLYIGNEESYKVGLLINGLNESETLTFDEKSKRFIDKSTGLPLSTNQAISQFGSESERKVHYLRTGVEIGVILSAAMGIYYKNLAYNSVDFDYGFKEGLYKKWVTGEAILYDDNDKSANYGHAFAGVLYHQIARSNGFNSLESFLITFASSAVWETMEYQEAFSLNDQIITPIGGYIIGEASYQVSCALFQKSKNIANGVVGSALTPALAFNKFLDRKKGNPAPDCDKPRWSEVSMYMGTEKNQKPYRAEETKGFIAGLTADVIKIDGIGKENNRKGLVYDTAMSKLLIELNGNEGLKDLRIVAQVVSAAYFAQKTKEDAAGRLQGYEVLVGVGSASTWNDRGYGEKDEEFYGTINILGATAHANLYYKGMKITAELGFYGDFAMVKSYALKNFEEAEGNLDGQSTIIQKRGYYFGLGSSTLAGISAEFGNIKVGYQMQSSSADIIHGREREHESITREDSFSDTLQIGRFYISFKIMKHLGLQITHETYTRTGSINGMYTQRGTEKRTMGTLVYHF